MNKLLLFIISCLLLTPSVFAGDDQLFSLKPPIPENKPQFTASQPKPFVSGFNHMPVVLEVDKKGNVKSITEVHKSDSLYIKFVSDYLKLFTFRPALKNGKKVKSQLPIIVHLSERISSPDVEFPVTEQFSSSQLLQRFFKLNDIELPKIKSFPSYNADIKPTDSSLYRIQFYELTIEESGKLSSIDKSLSSYPNFDGQIESAMLYASFSPMKEKSKTKRSKSFLKISYFPVLHYPVGLFDSTFSDSLSQLSKRRLEILPESVKLLSEPLPRTIPDHLFPISNIQQAVHKPVEAYVHIDTSGKVTLMRTDTKIKNEYESVRKICKKLRLYPAIDISGNPVDFYGYIRFERFESSNIRISYLWLN